MVFLLSGVLLFGFGGVAHVRLGVAAFAMSLQSIQDDEGSLYPSLDPSSYPSLGPSDLGVKINENRI